MIYHTGHSYPRVLTKGCIRAGYCVEQGIALKDILFDLVALRAKHPDAMLKDATVKGHHLQTAFWGHRTRGYRYHRLYAITHPQEGSCPLARKVTVVNPIATVIEKGTCEQKNGWLRFIYNESEVLLPPSRGYIIYRGRPLVVTSTVLEALRRRNEVT